MHESWIPSELSTPKGRATFRKVLALNERLHESVWQHMVSDFPEAAREIGIFVRDTCRPADSAAGEGFRRHMYLWRRYYLVLHEVLTRYKRLVETEVWEPSVTGRPGANSMDGCSWHIDDVIAHESYAIAEAARERCRLETECFFFQSKLLLEHIAQTVLAYFGFQLSVDGSMHSHFKNRIKKLWSQRAGASMPTDLLALMRKLDRDVIQFRNRHIGHTPDSIRFGVRVDLKALQAIDSELAEPRFARISLQEEYEAFGVIAKPDEVLAQLGDYIRHMLRFMAENRQHSVLPPAVHDSSTPEFSQAEETVVK